MDIKRLITGLVGFFAIVNCATAGLPPTTTKGSGDSNNVVTYNILAPNIPITHSGVSATIGTIPSAGGGTGFTTFTTGDFIYASATNTLSKLGIGSTNNVLTVVSGAPAWAAVQAGSFGDCHVRLTVGNSYGATATAIRRFTTNSTVGSCLTYADDANTAATITTNEAGMFSIDWSYKKSASGVNAGITINQSGLTTTPDALTIANGSTSYSTCSTNTSDFCTISRTLYLASGDIIRANANANIANDNLEYFYVVRIAR